MKCSQCGENNIVSASYCEKCGASFTKEEKKKARSKTLVGRLEKIENIYEICTLKKITDSLLFKISSIAIVLFVGFFVWTQNGSHVQILENENYQIQYNTKKDEYYLFVHEDQTDLKLYLPNTVKNIEVGHYNQNDELKGTKKYNLKESIVLSSSVVNDYYIVKANKDKKKEEKLKVYIFKKEEAKQTEKGVTK